jgi:group I intron endonuclease
MYCIDSNSDLKNGFGYIYKMTSPSGRIYVGQSIKIKARIQKYKNNGCAGQIKLYNSLVKYGFENHAFNIIAGPLSGDEIKALNLWEVYYIKLFDTVESGLNSHEGGKNKIPNAATRLKMSEAQKARCKSTFSRGKKLTDEHKKKLSDVKLGKKASIETKLKMSKVHIGRVSWCKGLKSIDGKISKDNIKTCLI